MQADNGSTAQPAARPESSSGEEDAIKGTLEEAVLHSANQFHRWHMELEAARVAETEAKYQQYADALQQHLTSCRQLQEQVQLSTACARSGQCTGLSSGLPAAGDFSPGAVRGAAGAVQAGLQQHTGTPRCLRHARDRCDPVS